jgi:transcriptional regulator with XRE-family HTH domain
MSSRVSIDARGRWDSQGRGLLRAVLSRMSAVEVARRCGVSHTAIGKLAHGETKHPDLALAHALSRFSIAPHTWLEPPPTPNESQVAGDGSIVHPTKPQSAA